jgi:uncharacterized protein YbaP (TraB family)
MTARARIALVPAALLLSLAPPQSGAAQASPETDASPAPAEAEAVEEVTVTGERAGPGLWKVRRGDNTLYLLGTMSPLPRKVEWRSREVESVLDRAQRLIPSSTDVDADIGPIKAVRLYMQFRKLRDNPEDGTLGAVLPPELFQRFESLRLRYAPRNTDMLERRPVIAAAELWREALERSGLTMRNDVGRTVTRLARSRKIAISEPQVRIDDPQGALAEVAKIPVDAEIACMAATLDRLESDLAAARQRAEAWSVGDVSALRPKANSDQQEACWSALMTSPKIAEIRERFDRAWFDIAIDSLEKLPVTLAVVPIEELLGRRGILERLRARGYEVDEPT